MNIAEYISSGILESYVLDQLTEKERSEVAQMAKQYPEVGEEIERIELSIEALALKSAVAPPPDIKDEIMRQAGVQETPVVPMSAGGSFLKYAAAASVVIALGTSILAFNYWSRWQSAEDRLADLVAQNQQFADNYNLVNQKLDNIQDAVAIMNNAAFSRVVMNGTDNSPTSLATVYWNKETEAVFLSIQDLKGLSQDQQYQLWAIVDGVPVDAGVFDSDGSSYLVQMKNTNPKAAAFAVTIEPKGGSETPSLETMQVIGNVKG